MIIFITKLYIFVQNPIELSRLDEISHYINHLSFDLKAEMLLAVLAEQRISTGEILAAFNGQLKRVWSTDINFAAVEHFETGDNMLSLHLNRDSIYDLLPEALFHRDPGHEDQTGEEMAKETVKLRTEEKEARTFFQPFENEIFLQGVKLTMMENKLFKSIFSEFLTGLVSHFWRMNYDLPECYVSRMKKLFPLVYQITGDLNLTSQCLEYVLKEQVRVISDYEQIENIDLYKTNYSGILGESKLGVDTISGNQVNGFINHLVFSIGPINKPETIENVKNGIMNSFLDCFYSYFIPFELDVDTKYIFGTDQSTLLINDDANAEMSYLGYNSVIQ